MQFFQTFFISSFWNTFTEKQNLLLEIIKSHPHGIYTDGINLGEVKSIFNSSQIKLLLHQLKKPHYQACMMHVILSQGEYMLCPKVESKRKKHIKGKKYPKRRGQI